MWTLLLVALKSTPAMSFHMQTTSGLSHQVILLPVHHDTPQPVHQDTTLPVHQDTTLPVHQASREIGHHGSPMGDGLQDPSESRRSTIPSIQDSQEPSHQDAVAAVLLQMLQVLSSQESHTKLYERVALLEDKIQDKASQEQLFEAELSMLRARIPVLEKQVESLPLLKKKLADFQTKTEKMLSDYETKLSTLASEILRLKKTDKPGLRVKQVQAIKEDVYTYKNNVLSSRDHVLEARDHVLPSRDPVLEARDHVLPSRDPVLEARDHLLSSRDHVLEARDHVLSSRDPVPVGRHGENDIVDNVSVATENMIVAMLQDVVLPRDEFYPQEPLTVCSKSEGRLDLLQETAARKPSVCLQVSTTPLVNWTTAHHQCQAIGGELSIVDNVWELSELLQLQGNRTSFWIESTTDVTVKKPFTVRSLTLIDDPHLGDLQLGDLHLGNLHLDNDLTEGQLAESYFLFHNLQEELEDSEGAGNGINSTDEEAVNLGEGVLSMQDSMADLPSFVHIMLLTEEKQSRAHNTSLTTSVNASATLNNAKDFQINASKISVDGLFSSNVTQNVFEPELLRLIGSFQATPANQTHVSNQIHRDDLHPEEDRTPPLSVKPYVNRYPTQPDEGKEQSLLQERLILNTKEKEQVFGLLTDQDSDLSQDSFLPSQQKVLVLPDMLQQTTMQCILLQGRENAPGYEVVRRPCSELHGFLCTVVRSKTLGAEPNNLLHES